ncbi:MAG: nucleotidyltransferase domain-containing protein [Acidobacteriota bacterium]|nr:nucleotidyltransferase domain-containing protein [Acidobacteriota bacterium]
MDKKILKTLKIFKNTLEDMKIHVKRIIIFGSYATGKEKKDSDIDVIVISNDFNGMNIFRRLEILGLALARAKIFEPIEAIGYTEEEFTSRGEGTFIGDEVKTKGVQIL